MVYIPTAFIDNGVRLAATSGDVIAGNYIGTDAAGTVAIANFGSGVRIDTEGSNNTIGGNSAAAGNVIAYNGSNGVTINTPDENGGGGGGAADTLHAIGNTIRLNSIFANKRLGIDLGENGRTINDPGDADAGANDLQNFPVIATASSTGSSVTVTGTLNSVAAKNFTLDFYAAATADAYGNAQGKQYLGSIGVITDAGGNSTFSGTFNAAIGSNKFITATATNASTSPYGDTSEFSQAIEATAAAPVAPPVPPSISISDVKQNEGNSGTTPFTFTLTRGGDLSSVSTVTVTTTDGTATAGSDYTALSNQQVTFAANQATATVVVNINGDATVESDETFNVNVTAVTNATIADGQGVGTIVNDDVVPPPNISINDVAQSEGNSGSTAFTFTLTRTGDLTNSSILSVSTTDGTAAAGSDYTALSGTLVAFAANQSTATVTVNVNGDTTVEANETFNVNVTSVTNATIGDGQGVGTIVNDDVTPPPGVSINDVSKNEGNSGTTAFTFTLTRSGDLSQTSSVSVSTADGTATAGSDYTPLMGTVVTFAANQATASVTVNVNGDTTVEANETFAVKVTPLTNATIIYGQALGTIVNDDVAPPPPAMAGALSGYTFNDSNSNGKFDSGDGKAGGKTVFLDTNNNGVLDAGEKSIVSDSCGNFSFTGLAAGTYHVRRVFPSGYTYSTPLIDVVLKAGQTVTNLAIGSKTIPAPTPPSTGSISGFVFNDVNKDGYYEASSESKTTGNTVFLDTNNNGKLDAGETSVVTGAGGVFNFTGLAAGTYHVRDVLSSGYTYSTKLIDLVLGSGQAASGLTIGAKKTK